jgi:hypothetical protein
MSNYGVKHCQHRDWPRPTLTPPEAAHILAPPQLNGIGVSCWLESRGLAASDLCSARLEEFRADEATRTSRAPTLVASKPLLDWLRDIGVCGDDPAPAVGPVDALMERYRVWLVTDRQLAPRTVERYQKGARRFLEDRLRQGGAGGSVVEGQDTASVEATTVSTEVLARQPAPRQLIRTRRPSVPQAGVPVSCHTLSTWVTSPRVENSPLV